MIRIEAAHPRSRGARSIALLIVPLITLAFALALPATIALADGHEAHEQDIQRTPAPEGAKLYFITPESGATVSSPVTIRFGLSSMGVAPAGVAHTGTGHHHLLIDTGLPDLALPVPSDAKHRHFGGGQTQVQIELAPGRHTLQLLLGDHLHIPHDPPVMSERIEISVE